CVRGPSRSADGQQRSRTPTSRPGGGAEELLWFRGVVDWTFGSDAFFAVPDSTTLGHGHRQMADRLPVGLRESERKTSARPAKLHALEHDNPGTRAIERGKTTETARRNAARCQPSYRLKGMISAISGSLRAWLSYLPQPHLPIIYNWRRVKKPAYQTENPLSRTARAGSNP